MKTTRRNRRKSIIKKILKRMLNGTRGPNAREMKLNGFAEFRKAPIKLLFPWGRNTGVQGGSNGIVFCDKPYRTAYFEAFPKLLNEVIPTRRRIRRHRFTSTKGEKIILDPSGWQGIFIRGEGKTIRHAEIDCWLRWMRIVRCRDHVMDRRNRTDGYCYCVKCGMSDTLLEPLTSCHVCGVKTCWSMYGFNTEPKERWFCEEHCDQQWDDPDLTDKSKRYVEMFRRLKNAKKAKPEDVLEILAGKGTT